LWSDPRDDSAQEQRRTAELLRRFGLLIAGFAVLLLILVMA
jgi:hypothetical protein